MPTRERKAIDGQIAKISAINYGRTNLRLTLEAWYLEKGRAREIRSWGEEKTCRWYNGCIRLVKVNKIINKGTRKELNWKWETNADVPMEKRGRVWKRTRKIKIHSE